MKVNVDFTDLVDLASERLGGSVLDTNDDFFAEKENLLKAAKPVWREHDYTERGKWMDGWESRRRRIPGHDHCVIRLGVPGVVRGVVVDTSFFRGNFPSHCSIEACFTRIDAGLEALASPDIEWFELLGKSPLAGDSQNRFVIEDTRAVSHLRFHIYPDGGVARLRVHGEVLPEWRSLGGTHGTLDLASVDAGGEVVACSDMFFGPRHNLIMPGRAVNMGDGWETRRRRGPGNDWVLVKLSGLSTIERIELDTNHFKGNYPDSCSIEACDATGISDERLARTEGRWLELLPRTKLQAHTRHFFVEELRPVGEVTHVRVNVFPDGGVSRLRILGKLTQQGRYDHGLRRLNALSRRQAEAELRKVCGSSKWVASMVDFLPYSSIDALFAASDRVSSSLGETDWLEAFLHHPRIGENAAKAAEARHARGWSEREQSGMDRASQEARAALAELNREYEAKFGFIFLICATGKSAEEMLAQARARLANARDVELGIAVGEQRKITTLRLEKLVQP